MITCVDADGAVNKPSIDELMELIQRKLEIALDALEVAAAEREACAKIADRVADNPRWDSSSRCSAGKAIAFDIRSEAAGEIAEAIRARGRR